MRTRSPAPRPASRDETVIAYRAPSPQALVLTVACALVASAIWAFSRPVELRVDGVRVLSDVPPIVTERGVLFVPVRSFADALGARTEIEPGGVVTIERGDQVLRLRVGSRDAMFDGTPLVLNVAPFRVRGRVMVGLAAMSTAFGVRAVYDPRTRRIDVLAGGVIDPRLR